MENEEKMISLTSRGEGDRCSGGWASRVYLLSQASDRGGVVCVWPFTCALCVLGLRLPIVRSGTRGSLARGGLQSRDGGAPEYVLTPKSEHGECERGPGAVAP